MLPACNILNYGFIMPENHLYFHHCIHSVWYINFSLKELEEFALLALRPLIGVTNDFHNRARTDGTWNDTASNLVDAVCVMAQVVYKVNMIRVCVIVIITLVSGCGCWNIGLLLSSFYIVIIVHVFAIFCYCYEQ